LNDIEFPFCNDFFNQNLFGGTVDLVEVSCADELSARACWTIVASGSRAISIAVTVLSCAWDVSVSPRSHAKPMPNAVARHDQGLRANKRAENSHQPTRRRERKMQARRGSIALRGLSHRTVPTSPRNAGALATIPGPIRPTQIRVANMSRREPGRASFVHAELRAAQARTKPRRKGCRRAAAIAAAVMSPTPQAQRFRP
jgi:hypothetical protein